MNRAEFVRLRRALADRLTHVLAGLFAGVNEWDQTEAKAFTAKAVPLALGARATMAHLTTLWVADQASTHTGAPILPISVPDDVLARPGITPERVYARPFVTTQVRLAQGRPIEQAVSAGSARLAQVAEGDLQRAHSMAAQAAIQALPPEATPVGWRRELTGANSCGACVLASTRLFDSGVANPQHPNCDCIVVLDYGNQPPPSAQRVARIRDAVKELTGGSDLSEAQLDRLARQMIATHGELGPVLVRPNDHFTTAADLRGPTTPRATVAGRRRARVVREPTGPVGEVARASPVSGKARIEAPPGEVNDQIETALAAIDKVHDDGQLSNIVIGAPKNALPANMLGEFSQATTPIAAKRVDRITLARLNDHVAFTAVHEVGHWIDLRALSDDAMSFASAQTAPSLTAELKAWRHEVVSSPTYRTLAENGPRASMTYTKYLSSNEELWARSYAQYIATRSADETLLGQLQKQQYIDSNPLNPYPQQWNDKEFEPIGNAIDGVLKKQGWLR